MSPASPSHIAADFRNGIAAVPDMLPIGGVKLPFIKLCNITVFKNLITFLAQNYKKIPTSINYWTKEPEAKN